MNQMGIKNLINRNAPAGEQVAFINQREADLLRRSGGSGRTDNNPYGIPSYDDVDESGGDDGDYSGEGDSSYGGGDDEQTSPQSDYGGSAMFADSLDSINSASGLYSAPATGGPVDLTTPLNTRAPTPNKSNEEGFFEGIGNFLSRTASNIVNNPGTFLMNMGINSTGIGALANIVSGLTTGSSIGTNISNTVGKGLGFDPVNPSPFNQALGDVGQAIGVFGSLPNNINIQDFFSQREPTLAPVSVLLDQFLLYQLQ